MLFEEILVCFACCTKLLIHKIVLLLQQLFFNMQTLVWGGGEGGREGVSPQIISLIGSFEQLRSISAKIKSYKKFIFN